MTLLWFIAVSCAQHPQGSWGFLDDYIGLGPFKWVKNYPQLDHLKAAPFGGAAWFAIDTLGCLFNLLEIILFQVDPIFYQRSCPRKIRYNSLPGPIQRFKLPRKCHSFLDYQADGENLGWHAIFRRNIIFCGWNPLEYIFSVFGKDAAKMGDRLEISDCYDVYRLWSGHGGRGNPQTTDGNYHERRAGTDMACNGLGCYGTAMVESWSVLVVIIQPPKLSLLPYNHSKVTNHDTIVRTIKIAKKRIARGLGRADIPPPRLWTWPRYLVPFSGLLPERWISRLESLAH
ncbi:hypothetical protein PSHT_11548 [Puccinia striiformis]|uniref:Uncharacterized protein n=1 Tax=Puccinia striiformis TaxID=27350 RepID=A0A2S4V2N2_9BASI|nr:hypothetical protein PSHT_11548 [Puccinia striiformis]